MTSLIPSDAPTMLPGGVAVESTPMATPQPGTRVTPRTAKGSGVYGTPGSVQSQTTAPVRDYVVRLVNYGPDFRMRYLTVEYFIAEGDELIVPWEVMVSFLGSPDIQNLGPRRMDRKNFYEKLRVKYGAYYDDDLWEQNKPKLLAYRVTGEQIITVVDDPDGLTITPSQVTQQQALTQKAQIDLMQRQLESMNQLIAQMSGQSKSHTFQEPPPDGHVPFANEGEPPDAPEAPEQPPFDPTATNMAPMPPPPVPGMTPQMPVPVASPEGEPESQAASVDLPRNPPISIG